MSKRKERTNIRLGYLNKINYIDKRLKKGIQHTEIGDKLLKNINNEQKKRKN